MEETSCIVIGAGPHGLAATAHLRRAGVETRVFGRPMSFWQTMPKGMMLRSNRTATSIAEYEGPLSLVEYQRRTGDQLEPPYPLDGFLRYSTWVADQVVPDVDTRTVVDVSPHGSGLAVTLDDGDQLAARHVVCAAGIADFVNRPDIAKDLPSELATHTSEHTSMDRFAGKRLLVVGGGQSALECAALAHEAGAEDVTVVARADHLTWLHGGKYHRMLGRYSKLVYAPTDVGPMGISRVVAVPALFGMFPRAVAEPMARRSIRPAGAAWLKDRLTEVPILVGRQVVAATPQGDQLRVRLDDGEQHVVDHMLFGTGYRVDVARYPFLGPALLARLSRRDGFPVLDRRMRSSVPGLSFVGAPGARSVGPTMRFISGGWYAGQAVAAAIGGPPHGSAAAGTGPVPTTA